MNRIQELKLKAKMQDNDIRRRLARKAIDYYNYNQYSYMAELIESRYPDTYSDLYEYIVTIDLAKSLTVQLAKLFSDDPAISIDGSQSVQDAFISLMDSVNLYGLLPMIDRYTETCNRIGVVPIYNERTQRIKLDFITPDRCIVWQDENDPTEATAVAYTIRQQIDSPVAERSDIFAMWTDSEYRIVTLKKDGSVDKDIEPAVPNPYGRIPIAWFSTEPQIDAFWPDRLFPMVNANERANIQLTNLDVALDYQSFSTLYTSGMPEGSKLLVGVQRYINIPLNPETGQAAGSVGYVTPSPQLQAVWQIINDNIALSASMMGISPEAIRQGSQFSSGYQLRLSKSDVIDRNMAKRSAYREPLRQLLQNIMDCNTFNTAVKLPADAMLKIDFADVKIENDPLQEEQLRSLKIQNGTMSRVDAIMQDNPDLSREDAIERITEIDSDNNRFKIPNDSFSDGDFA